MLAKTKGFEVPKKIHLPQNKLISNNTLNMLQQTHSNRFSQRN